MHLSNSLNFVLDWLLPWCKPNSIFRRNMSCLLPVPERLPRLRGTALRSIYCWRSEDEIKMGPNFNQFSNQSTCFRGLYPKYGGDFQATAVRIVSTRKRKIRPALRITRYMHMNTACLLSFWHKNAQTFARIAKKKKKKKVNKVIEKQ